LYKTGNINFSLFCRCTGETIFEDDSDTADEEEIFILEDDEDTADEEEIFILEDDEDQATKHIKNLNNTSDDENMEPKLTEEVLFICDKAISHLR